MTLFMPSDQYDSFQADTASSQAEGDYQDHLAGLQAVKEAHDSYFRQAGAIMSGQPTDDTDMTAGDGSGEGSPPPSPSPAQSPAPLTPSTPAVSPAPATDDTQPTPSPAPTQPTAAPATSSVPTTAGISGAANDTRDPQNLLGYAGQAASWLGEQGIKALQSVLVTEGGLNKARGDNGQSAGPLQFFEGGQLANFARDKGLSLEAAKAYVEDHAQEAIDWAIGSPEHPGYLGRAIQQGQQAGLSGSDLATYAQRHGQVSVSPERAGQNWQAMFGPGGTGAPAATTIPAGPQGLPVQSPNASPDATVNRPSQFGAGLSYADAMAACGPVAALALANKYGSGNIPAQAVVDAARSSGLWDAQNGMHGVAAEQQLLQKEGVATRLETNVDWDHVRSDVQNGNPVIVSTPGHYFVIDAVDPETGAFHVGTSGTDLKAGTEYMTPERMQQLEGAASGALYVDNPQAHGPSVAEHPQNLIDQANQTFQSAVGAATGTAGQAKDTAASVLQQAEDEFQKRVSDLGNSQLARNLTGTNPNQADLDAQSQLAHQQTQAATGADVRLPAGPGDLLNAGLGEPTGGEALASQRNEAIAANNPLRNVPVLGGATTFAGQAALDPTNLLLAGEPGVAGAAGSAAREGAGAVADVATSPAVQSALRSRLPAEAESGFAMGLPTGGSEVAAGAEDAAATADRAANIQLDKFPENVQPVIQAAADANPEGLEAARRGVLPDAVVKDLSQQTNLNVGELVQKWTPGQAFNAETLVATRDALDEQANRVLDAQQALRAAPDSVDAQTQMLNALSMHGQLQEVVTGATAEAGRALRATGSNATGGGVAVQRLQDWANMTGLTPDQVVEYLKTADLNNPSTLAQLAQGARRAADYLPPDEYLPSGPQAGQQALDLFGEGQYTYAPRPTGTEPLAEGVQPGQQALDMFGEGPYTYAPPPTGNETTPAGVQAGQRGLDMFGEGPYTYSGPRPTGTEPLAEGVQPGQARLPNFPNPNPASPQQQFRAYYVGDVVSSVPTLTKVATNAIINPTWQLGRHLIFDPASHPEALGPTITGYFRGLADAGGAALNVIANGVDAQAAAGLGSKAYQSVSSNVDNPLISKVLAASEFAPRLHAAAQQFTQVAVQRMELGRQAAIQAASEGLHGDQWAQRVDDLIAHPAPGMLASANDVAQRAALRGDLGTINSQFQKISQVPYAGTFLLPVVKIAANTLTGLVERSPFGLAGTAFDVARAKVGAGPYAGEASKAVTPLGERFQNNLMGSAITAALYGKAMEGAITGDGPSDPTQRQELMQRGWAPHSVYVPGLGYRDYHPLGVLAGPLATIGNVADTIKYDQPKDPQSLMAGTVQRMARFMADDSSLRSLGEVYNILTGRQPGGVEGAAASTIAGAAQGLIPAGAAVRSAAIASDPTQRAAQKGDLLERTREQVELGIPGLRQQIPPSRDLTGAPAPNPQYGAGILLPRGANTALPVPPQHAGEPVKYVGVKDPSMQAVIDGAIRRVNAWERDPTSAPRPSATDRQLENRYGGNTNPAWQAWRQRQVSGQQKADTRVLQFAPQPR